MPLITTPWMKRRWAKKNTSIGGSVISTETAMMWLHAAGFAPACRRSASHVRMAMANVCFFGSFR